MAICLFAGQLVVGSQPVQVKEEAVKTAIVPVDQPYFIAVIQEIS